MLVELHVRDLGVIADLHLVLGEGMTALTGETGAGKTLVVEAIDLLMGERADPALVRPGADEARVEARFALGAEGTAEELVLARAVPRSGRSRAYVDGRLATAAELAELGGGLVDLHGQHAHQSLLSPRRQRAALDRFACVDLAPLSAARSRVKDIDATLAGLGGDARARVREMDLLRFQIADLEGAALSDPAEDTVLEAREDTLADAAAHREAAIAAYEALADDDALGRAVEACAGRKPFAELEARFRALQAEVTEAATDIRRAGDAIVDEPELLDAVRARRRLLRELCRKYGDRLFEVIAFEAGARCRLTELESHGLRVDALEAERAVAVAVARREAATVAVARRRAAPELGARVEANLRTLAMAGARLQVVVGGADPADEVEFLLAANRGSPPLPLAKVASGGELARAMLAARLVLSDAPPTLVFDEVDAGVGGRAAVAVGRALAELAGRHQVLVVTHLPQVAAFADHQVAVTKQERAGSTVASAAHVTGADRVAELSRMLSGQPGSDTARGHAEELLETASRERDR